MTEAASLPGEAEPESERASLWEDLPQNHAGQAAPILSAEGFEGPLDWLLDMARAQKIDLAKLPIDALIQSFVAALEVAFDQADRSAAQLSRWGDWLVMAATLTQLRSRLLLPPDAPEAKAALSEAEALRRQLIGREEMRAAADWLDAKAEVMRGIFVRGRPELRGAGRSADIADLLLACLSLLEVPEDLIAAYRPRPPPFWKVSQAVARMEGILVEQPEGAELGAFLPRITAETPNREVWSRAALASTLVAGLELARGGKLVLNQEQPWGAILVAAAEQLELAHPRLS